MKQAINWAKVANVITLTSSDIFSLEYSESVLKKILPFDNKLNTNTSLKPRI